MTNKKKHTRSSGAIRKAQIFKAFDTLWRVGQVGELTMYDVAKFIGMSPSTHLTKILMEMVEAGTLGYTTEYHRSNRDKRMYHLCEREFKYPLFDQVSEQREIRINVNGRSI